MATSGFTQSQVFEQPATMLRQLSEQGLQQYQGMLQWQWETSLRMLQEFSQLGQFWLGSHSLHDAVSNQQQQISDFFRFFQSEQHNWDSVQSAARDFWQQFTGEQHPLVKLQLQSMTRFQQNAAPVVQPVAVSVSIPGPVSVQAVAEVIASPVQKELVLQPEPAVIQAADIPAPPVAEVRKEVSTETAKAVTEKLEDTPVAVVSAAPAKVTPAPAAKAPVVKTAAAKPVKKVVAKPAPAATTPVTASVKTGFPTPDTSHLKAEAAKNGDKKPVAVKKAVAPAVVKKAVNKSKS
ncbi:hypothetical protein [Undibacterium luofuense]|uniref:hypothetical protein n=1 Tax=Undibacterium luofuense TaxID=2828733 RepID=UPI0030ECB9D9